MTFASRRGLLTSVNAISLIDTGHEERFRMGTYRQAFESLALALQCVELGYMSLPPQSWPGLVRCTSLQERVVPFQAIACTPVHMSHLCKKGSGNARGSYNPQAELQVTFPPIDAFCKVALTTSYGGLFVVHNLIIGRITYVQTKHARAWPCDRSAA